MYNDKIMKRFSNLQFAGGLRGASATGKGGDSTCGDLVKIYIMVDEQERVVNAKFKAYGRVCTIVASDIACELMRKKSLDQVLEISAHDILDEMGQVPEGRIYSASIVEEAIKSAVEDYYKKLAKDKEGV